MHPLKKKIQKSFDKSSSVYDSNAKLQVDVLKKMFNFFVSENGFSNIFENVNFLDLGCGTGECAKLFSDKLKPKKIHLLDISKEMLKNSQKKFLKQNVILEQSDFDDFKGFQNFNFITSNMSFHWSCDFHKLFSRMVSSVNCGSIILMSFPSSVEIINSEGINNDLINNFPDLNLLGESVDKKQIILKVKKLKFTEKFNSELEFLKSLKMIGANVSNKTKNKKIFYLRRNFKKINVKYKIQVIFLRKI